MQAAEPRDAPAPPDSADHDRGTFRGGAIPDDEAHDRGTFRGGDPSDPHDDDALLRWASVRQRPERPTPEPRPLAELRDLLVEAAADGGRVFVTARLPNGERRACAGVISEVGGEMYELVQLSGRVRSLRISFVESVRRRP